MSEATKRCGGANGKVGPFCCGRAKPISEFHKSARSPDGKKSYCKECVARRNLSDRNRRAPEHRKASQRVYHLRHKYGITQAEYDELWSSQGGRCSCCYRTPEEAGHKGTTVGRLFVDHCHETGKNRALLCHDCNIAIGKVRENPETLLNLSFYRVGWRARHRGASSEQIAAVRAGAAALKTAFKIWLAESLPDDVPIPDAAQPAA